MEIIQIVPRLPPAISGLGDYALSLARQLYDELGIETRFIVGDNSWRGEASVGGFNVTKVESLSASHLTTKLAEVRGTSAALLHYVGYGYARRGCPFWLVDGLRQWKQGGQQRSLMTMFHETHASGQPWTSSFWLSPVQKMLVARLAQVSDHCLTNRESSAELVRKLSRDKHSQVEVLPVFSNVGELKQPSSLTERPRKMIVFGTKGRRLQVYQRSREILGQLCSHLGIDEVFDVGCPLDLDFSIAKNVRVTILGELPGEAVSQLLSNSIAGFLDYPEALLSKSGIFAAYCAHRVLPIIATYGEAEGTDGLEAGTHYWLSNFSIEDLTAETSQQIADNAFRWYQTHNLPKHSEVFASYLMSERETLVA
jgi:hypothetical protein